MIGGNCLLGPLGIFVRSSEKAEMFPFNCYSEALTQHVSNLEVAFRGRVEKWRSPSHFVVISGGVSAPEWQFHASASARQQERLESAYHFLSYAERHYIQNRFDSMSLLLNSTISVLERGSGNLRSAASEIGQRATDHEVTSCHVLQK
jgi:hypothetical protein